MPLMSPFPGRHIGLSRRDMIAGGAALVLSGRAAAQQDDWPKVIDAARQEGKVVIYNAAIGAGYYTEVAKAFERSYGIRVETLDVRASELRERVRAEQAAGRFLGDVEQHGAATAFRQEQEGAFAPHG